MIIHKSTARHRRTVCNLWYSDRKNMIDFIKYKLAGHWRRVTCKNCLKQRGKK